MARGIVIALLIMIAILLVLDTPHGVVRAKEDADNLTRILQNQKLILEKLGGIDKKIDQLKMRVR